MALSAEEWHVDRIFLKGKDVTVFRENGLC